MTRWRVSMKVGGLGWPEGPAVFEDGSLLFVESYRGRLTLWAEERAQPEAWATVGGAPNSCAVGSSGEVYVCQNGGTTGPWRAATQVEPGIQVIETNGSIRYVCTAIDGIALNGPNDLAFGPDGSLYFTDPGVYRPSDPEPSRIFVLQADGGAALLHEFASPVFPNGIVVEPDGSVVWNESYTGHVGRLRSNGTIEDLGRLPGPNPLPDGMAIGSDGRLFVTDLAAGGLHVLEPDGAVCGFVPCGSAPTNCAFAGETLYVTDAGVLATSAEPSFAGALWAVIVSGGGMEPFRGSIP